MKEGSREILVNLTQSNATRAFRANLASVITGESLSLSISSDQEKIVSTIGTTIELLAMPKDAPFADTEVDSD